MAQWEYLQHLRTTLVALGIVCLLAGLSGCGRPVHVWEAHAYATPVPPSLDISALGREPILALIPATYNQLQGHIPMVAHALAAACSQTEPKLNLRSEYEIFNTVNHQQAGLEYAEADPTFAASRLLAPTRLKELGAALGVKYILQPGLVYIKEDLEDKFEFGGFVFVRARVITMGLWLRLWDAQTGQFLMEASGEATVAAGLLVEGATVPFHETARNLWKHMIQEALLSGKTTSGSFHKANIEP
jgi:hypothetical protein